MSSNSNARKTKSSRVARQSRVNAAPYPSESDTIVFVNLSMNSQAAAEARQNVQNRHNRRMARSSSISHTDSLELLNGRVSSIADNPQSQESSQPLEAQAADDATSSNTVNSQDSQSSFQTISEDNSANDEEGESSSTSYSDVEIDDNPKSPESICTIQPLHTPAVDCATSSKTVNSEESLSSFESGDYSAYDEEGESSSISYSDVVNDEGDEQHADDVNEEEADDVVFVSGNIGIKSEDPEPQPDPNTVDNSTK